MNILITLCARGGSKGIPGKNIKLLNGKPLLYYSLETAIKFSNAINCNTNICLSTDSVEIIRKFEMHSLSPNCIIRRRPESLATDNSGKIEVIEDAFYYAQKIQNIEYDYVLDLDVTSPLRTVEDLTLAFKKLQNSPEAFNLFSVSKASRNPYFNMVEVKDDGFAALCKEGTYLSRQTSPKVYEINGSFYFYRANFFDSNFMIVITDKTLIYEVPHICFDIDNPIDFEFMGFLIDSNKLDFEI